MRFALKVDSTQKSIVSGLREAGFKVWLIGEPCDLLTYYPAKQRWRPLECKPTDLHNRNRKDQESQAEFLASYAVPVVRTVGEAITALLAE